MRSLDKDFFKQIIGERICKKNSIIYKIALLCGYSNGSKFAKAFKETFGVLPTQYRKEMGASK